MYVGWQGEDVCVGVAGLRVQGKRNGTGCKQREAGSEVVEKRGRVYRGGRVKGERTSLEELM